MLERTLFVVVLAVAGYALYVWTIHQQKRNISQLNDDPILAQLQPGLPAIVYFTTPGCAPCRTQQTPALVQLEHVLNGQVKVIRVDASQQAESAQRWGVMTAPTTFVIDASGQTRAVNHGVADAEKLRRQLGHATID